MPDIDKNWRVFQDENKCDGAKQRQTPGEKPASVCFTPDWERNSPFNRTITYYIKPNLHWRCLPRRQ
jgi:hypothetical protein